MSIKMILTAGLACATLAACNPSAVGTTVGSTAAAAAVANNPSAAAAVAPSVNAVAAANTGNAQYNAYVNRYNRMSCDAINAEVVGLSQQYGAGSGAAQAATAASVFGGLAGAFGGGRGAAIGNVVAGQAVAQQGAQLQIQAGQAVLAAKGC